jgi:hypothetical protein
MKKRASQSEQNTTIILIKTKWQTNKVKIKKEEIYYLLLCEYTSWPVVRILIGLHNIRVT